MQVKLKDYDFTHQQQFLKCVASDSSMYLFSYFVL